MANICIAYIISTVGGNPTINYSYNTIDDTTGNITASNTHDKMSVLPSETDLVNAINTINNKINEKLNPTTTPVTGNITIQYIDANNNNLESPTIMSGLALATYVFNAKSFTGYNLTDSNTKMVSLDNNNTNVTIQFKYTAIVLGSVTIKYEKEDGTEISTEDTYNNLALGNYTYFSKQITGYTLNGSSSQTVQLTSEQPTQQIIFKYTTNA